MSKTQKKYSIVEFPDGLQIVPSCWINTHQNESIWPSRVKSQYTLDKLLTKGELPSKIDTWDICKIKRIFGSAGKLRCIFYHITIFIRFNSIFLENIVIIKQIIFIIMSYEICKKIFKSFVKILGNELRRN